MIKNKIHLGGSLLREYDEKTLKQLHRTEMDILKDFIEICEKNDLTYFGFAGTAIGALRHKGFIPWDDDIDVGLPREDYEKFLIIAAKELQNKYIIMNGETNENYPLMSTRLMKMDTKFREYSLKNINCQLGIFLDIYAFDNVSDDHKEFKKQMREAWFFSKLLILRSVPFPVLGFKGFKAFLVHLCTAFIHYLMVIFRVPKKYIYKRCKAVGLRYNDRRTERIDYLFDTTPTMNIIKVKDLYPLVKLDFEDVKLNFPNNMHENLTNMYGDYMKLPPLEKRKNHYPYELEFDNEI